MPAVQHMTDRTEIHKIVKGSLLAQWPFRWARGNGLQNLRLVGLKLIFLVVSRAMSVIRLPHREWWWKDARS
jgi:hypothetical protein